MTRWFDRTFTLGIPVSDATAVVDRLRDAPARLAAALEGVPPPVLVHRAGGKWSMQEQAGHLLDLEALFDARLDDFDAGAPVLRPADLDNRKTHEAQHNCAPVSGILADFGRARAAMVARLDRMTPSELARVSRHPRLNQPMSVVDLCYFIAEHDDHHLAAIAAIAAVLGRRPVYALDLVNTVERAEPWLRGLDEATARMRPAPGQWSAVEIVGHLVDSASNNHQRFVRAIFEEDLVVVGYMQDEWVAAQRYQDGPWLELVGLWAGFNRHLAHVMSSMPEDARTRPRVRHNLDRMAFRAVPAGQPATLGYFMEDYVEHLKHHLRQIADGGARA